MASRTLPLILTSLPYRTNPRMAHHTLLPTKRAITAIYAKNVPPPLGSYSPATKSTPSPTLLFVSGQVPLNSDGAPIAGTVMQRTRACLASLDALLLAGGSHRSRILKVSIFLTDMRDFADVNAEYETFLKDVEVKPARSCVAVAGLPKGVDVEVDCIAEV